MGRRRLGLRVVEHLAGAHAHTDTGAAHIGASPYADATNDPAILVHTNPDPHGARAG